MSHSTLERLKITQVVSKNDGSIDDQVSLFQMSKVQAKLLAGRDWNSSHAESRLSQIHIVLGRRKNDAKMLRLADL